MINEIHAVRQIFAAINQNRIADVLTLCDPEVIRIEPEGYPTAGTYSGHAELVRLLAQGRDTWAEGTCSPEGFIIIVDKIVALLHVRVRLKDRTDWIDGRFADVFTFRQGLVTEMRTFWETHEALLWSGAAVSGVG